MENNKEKEVFEVTIERNETPRMCRDTIKFSADCRKHRKRIDGVDRYQFPVGSVVRLNGKELAVTEVDFQTACNGCALDKAEDEMERFASSVLCVSTACCHKFRKDGRNIQYKPKEEEKEEEENRFGESEEVDVDEDPDF